MSSDSVLSGILSNLRKAYASAADVFFAFGDAMISLRKHGYSWSQAGRVIREAFPHSEAETGLTLGDAWLRRASVLAEKFTADGGYASPDGKHRVSREEYTKVLKLNNKQRDQVADLIAYSDGEAALKGAPKLRVSDLESAVNAIQSAQARAATASTPKKRLAAKQSEQDARAKLAKRIDEVAEALGAVESEDELAQLLIQDRELTAKIARLEDSLSKAQSLRNDLRVKIRALQAAEEAEAIPAQEVEQPASLSKAARKRQAATVAAQATA